MPGGTIVRDGPPPSPPPPPAPPRPAGTGGAPRPTSAANDDRWPRTSRWLPWLIATFIATLWLVPIDSFQAQFSFPIDPKLDRILLSLIAIVWLIGLFTGGRAAPRWRPGLLDGLVILFAGIAILSVVLNALVLARLDELDLAIRKLGLLTSYVTFFFIVATSIRPRELSRFAVLFVTLACVTAVGVLWEYSTDYNPFVEWWNAILPDGAFEYQRTTVGSPFATPPVTGPARHALALAAMFAMAISFAVVGIARGSTLRRKALYALAFALIAGGVFATSRKTGSFAGVAVAGALLALRPRSMLRLAPFALVAFVAVLLIAPNAVEKQVEQLDPRTVTEGASSEGRSSDYQAIVPDVRDNLVVGRGYGAYDPHKYRILDNNYLVLLLETGLVGLMVFAGMILMVPITARRAIRSRDPARWGPALAAGAGAIGFGVATALFDVLAFAQVPYMFFFLAAVAAVSRAPDSEWEAPTTALTAVPPAEPARPAARAEALRRRASATPRRTAGEHAGARVRPPQPAVPGTAPPGAPAPPRVRTTTSGEAPHGGRRRRDSRRRAGAVLTLLLIGLVMTGLGRGTEEAAESLIGLGGGGSGGDPFAATPSPGGGEESPAEGPADKAAGKEPEPSQPAGTEDDEVLASTPAQPAAEATGSTEPGDPPSRPGDGDDPKPEKPQKPERPEKPDKPDPPQTPPTVVAADCLPGDLDEDLAAIGLEPCAGSPTVSQVQSDLLAAARKGRVSQERAEKLAARLADSRPGVTEEELDEITEEFAATLDELELR